VASVPSDQQHRARIVAGVLTGALCVAAVAWGQSIKMPDFRQPAAYRLEPGEFCEGCGRVLSIREKSIDRRPAVPSALSSGNVGSGGGVAQSNFVGAVIYLPLGESGEKPFVGGVGTPEMRERFRETTYEIAIRLDDGAIRFVESHEGTRFQIGDRVRVSGVNDLELVVQ
jgi:outer membrane lipoprotein SlyB